MGEVAEVPSREEGEAQQLLLEALCHRGNRQKGGGSLRVRREVRSWAYRWGEIIGREVRA